MLEHTAAGQVARLRSTGPGRFFAAAFLGVWLCGWAAGECFALLALGTGVVSLATGGRIPVKGIDSPAGVVVFGGFLVLWLTLWTFGGWAAGTQFLRLLWGEDTLLVDGAGLTRVRRAGPFRRTKSWARDTIRGFDVTPSRSFQLLTSSGAVTLSDLGTIGEREALAGELREAFGGAPAATPENPSASATTLAPDEPVQLPDRWIETIDPDGTFAIVPEPRARQRGARIVWVLALLLLLFDARLFASVTDGGRTLLAPLIVVSALAALLVWGAAWLSWGRVELRVEDGRIVVRRRLGARVRDVFEGNALQITVGSDEGTDTWSLDLLAEGASPSTDVRTRLTRRNLAHGTNDRTRPFALGRYLAARARIPLHDLTTASARTATLAELRAQLRGAGAFGRFVEKLIPREGPR